MPDLFRRARSLTRALAPEHSCIVISTPALPDPTYDASRFDPPLPCLICLYMLLVQLHVVPPQSFVQASFPSALPLVPPFHLIQRWVTVRACPSLHGGVTISPHPRGGCPVVAAASLGPPARRGGRTSTGLAMPSRCGASLCSTCLAMPSRFCSHTVACCLDRSRILLHRPGLAVWDRHRRREGA